MRMGWDRFGKRVSSGVALMIIAAGSAVAAEAVAPSEPSGLFFDPGFERSVTGAMEETAGQSGWEIQKTGRDSIKESLTVMTLDEPGTAYSGRKCLALSIPRQTSGFEFVTVGQRVMLKEDQEYEATVWVRWPDGPDVAPEGADAVSGAPSAIVSFWARHRDGNGQFAGRDVWLFDNQWTKITIRFRETDPGQSTLIYVSLLPNQTPVDSTIWVDDFDVGEVSDPVHIERRTSNILQDGDFSAQSNGVISIPWYYKTMGGTSIVGRVATEDQNNVVKMSMPPETGNYESAQLWQHIGLVEGARYEISCRMRWDNFSADAPAPIVNYGIYHEESRTWYGPVDQVLERTGEWRVYRFAHVPPVGGPWKIYVQLNGWGNFEKGVAISVDDIICRAGVQLEDGQEESERLK